MNLFTIAAAQASSIKGDVAANVRRHVEFGGLAREQGADVVVFPELSLTGYEPTIAAQTAVDAEDGALGPLRDLADEAGIVVMAGCPLRSAGEKPYIGMVIFQPRETVAVYRKRFVHASELPYFIASDEMVVFPVRGMVVGAAICADINNPTHAADAAARGANVYAAGVAKTPPDIARATANMAAHAKRHRMLAVMANHASATGGNATAGRSAIWNERGELLAQAEPEGECLVLARQTPDGWAGSVVQR